MWPGPGEVYTYDLNFVPSPEMDLGRFVGDLNRAYTGTRKVKVKDVAKNRARNKAARKARKGNR